MSTSDRAAAAPARTLTPLLSPLPGILDCPSLNMLAGASGLGKTAFLASFLAGMDGGKQLFGQPTQAPPRIGYVCTDRPWASASQWFTKAGLSDLAHYSMIDDRQFDVAQLHGGKNGPALLAHCVEQLGLPRGSLIIVDPIALFLGGRLNDYTTTSIACIGVQRWLIDAGYVLIGVCHTSKLKADENDRYARPQDRILGSGALLGYSSTQMYLMGPDEAGRTDDAYTFLWNPHHRPSASFLLDRTSDGLFNLGGFRRHYADTAADPGKPLTEAQEKMCNQILDLFPPAPEPIATADLMFKSLLLCTRQTLHRYLERLTKQGKIEKSARGTWRRIPVV